jgi:UDP-N-acetylmuramoyl-L-alanyl-D-glutamate--2,6-diaminopimelate ligase
MERFGGDAGQPLVVVDYAHTPRALEQVLLALRGHCRGRLWCVFGAGGDRDRGKRPLMGAVAERLADRVLLTNDNPRSEAPDAILAEIQAGMARPQAVQRMPDRAEAIHHAVGQAGPGDLVLVAGKGHEDYQQIGAERRPFSDRAQVLAALAGGAA